MLTYNFAMVQECWFTQFMRTNLGICILIALTFSLYLHACTGIRHLFWDMGKGFEVKTMTVTGYASLIIAVLLTALTWVVILSVIGG